MTTVVMAFLGYLFLVMVVRIVGRRPGKQMTPFEFVLIFFIGGLALTAIVGDEVSYTMLFARSLRWRWGIMSLPGLDPSREDLPGWWTARRLFFLKIKPGARKP